jgi:proline iminopeptidase
MLATIRDTSLYFDIDGVGLQLEGAKQLERPTAFLVHGGPGIDHTSGKARYGRLREKMQLVYFDHRGQGRSGRGDPAKYTLDENVEDMEGLRRHLGLERIVSLGTSYGGMVAMAHAARYPRSVSHLILVATAAHGGFIAAAAKIVRERGTAEQIAQFEDVRAGRIDTAQKMRRYFEVMGSLYTRSHDPGLSAAALEQAILAPQALNRALGPEGFLTRFDLRPELGKIRAPTLILSGRYDWICPPEFALEMHELIANSDLRIFEESAHSIAGDEPQKLLDAVAGFLVYRTNPP